MKNKNYLILASIVFIAIILRFWNLTSVPPSINWDEASLGYNAYSILMTGRDEYGKLFPIIAQSLGDFKPALYIYLIIPFIKFFGLSEIAVRLPAAIFGVISVIATYFLVKELFKKEKLALLSSFLLAISPWSIQFSRFASEAMVGLTFNLLMVLFFIKGLKNPVFLCLSAIFGALSVYAYQSEKIFVPLLGLILVVAFYKDLIKIHRKYIYSAIIVGALFVLPILLVTLTDSNSLTRAKGTSFMNNPKGVYEDRLVARVLVDKQNADILGQILDNRRVVYVKAIAGNYLSHFDPNFLFINGDINPRHRVPNMGHLYLFELPFLLLGFYFLFAKNYKRENKLLLMLWILIVPVAAAFTWEVPHAIRTLNFLPVFQIITAIGLISAYSIISKNKYLSKFRYLFVGIFVLVASVNILFYLNQYFVQYKFINSQDWQYGYREVVGEVEKLKENYDKVIVSDNFPMDQSYIFVLFYTKYSPSLYQNRVNRESKNFDKFEFRRLNEKENLKNRIYIAPTDQIPWDYDKDTLFRQNYLNGKGAMVIVKS